MDKEAQEVWSRAGDYCSLALEKLMLRPTRNLDCERDPTSDALVVHFLFPNLAEAERSLLFSIQELSRTVNLGVTSPTPSGADPKDRDAGLRAAEEMYTDLKNRLNNSGLMEKLTAVQRQILDAEFLAIHFKE